MTGKTVRPGDSITDGLPCGANSSRVKLTTG